MRNCNKFHLWKHAKNVINTASKLNRQCLRQCYFYKLTTNNSKHQISKNKMRGCPLKFDPWVLICIHGHSANGASSYRDLKVGRTNSLSNIKINKFSTHPQVSASRQGSGGKAGEVTLQNRKETFVSKNFALRHMMNGVSGRERHLCARVRKSNGIDNNGRRRCNKSLAIISYMHGIHMKGAAIRLQQTGGGRAAHSWVSSSETMTLIFACVLQRQLSHMSAAAAV